MAFLRRATLTLPDAAHDPPLNSTGAWVFLQMDPCPNQSSGEGDIRRKIIEADLIEGLLQCLASCSTARDSCKSLGS